VRLEKISEAVKVLLESIGEDVDREGLLKTPERYAKALLFLTKGYIEDLEGKKKENDFAF
jgi:GTP cyclohydrolase IA